MGLAGGGRMPVCRWVAVGAPERPSAERAFVTTIKPAEITI